MPAKGFLARAERFFFLHVGVLVGVVVYFVVFESSQRSASGVRNALLTALVTQSVYIGVARRRGELKQFDLGFALLYLLGSLAVLTGIPGVLALFQQYSAAIVFATFGLTALLPPLVGIEPFPFHFMRRTVPAWQLRLPVSDRIGRVVWLYWLVIFAVCTALAVAAPLDPRFTALYPNLLIFGLGITGNWWLPALYLKFFPPERPTTAEPLIMGMPTVFDARAARGIRAEIQFRLRGAEAGDYWVRIAEGRCESFEGLAPAPDVTVRASGETWTAIVHRTLDGAQAMQQGLLEVDGDGSILAQFPVWFPPR